MDLIQFERFHRLQAVVTAGEIPDRVEADQVVFFIRVSVEVSAAIIRVITRYLRSQLKYAQTVSAQLRALESFGFLSPSAGS